MVPSEDTELFAQATIRELALYCCFLVVLSMGKDKLSYSAQATIRELALYSCSLVFLSMGKEDKSPVTLLRPPLGSWPSTAAF